MTVSIHEPASPWEITSLRFSGFAAVPLEFGADLFEEIFGFSSSEQVIRKSEMLVAFNGIRQAWTCALACMGARVDLSISAGVFAFGGDMPGLPERGDISAMVGVLVDGSRLLAERFPLKRIAVGADFTMVSTSVSESNDKLRKYLPALNFEGDVEDLLFRINRKRLLQLGGISFKINRLTQWSGQGLHVSTPDGSIHISWTMTHSSDVNTAAEFDFSSLELTDRLQTLDVLFENTAELAHIGDIE